VRAYEFGLTNDKLSQWLSDEINVKMDFLYFFDFLDEHVMNIFLFPVALS